MIYIGSKPKQNKCKYQTSEEDHYKTTIYPKCNCNIDAAIEWCITTHCEGGNCLEAAHGCGDFIVQSCDGTCGGI